MGQILTPEKIATLRTDFLAFAKYMFLNTKGSPMMVAPFHVEICDALERCVIGQTKRLIINISPRSGKTELAVKMFIAWSIGNFPDSEFIHASYSKTLAALNTSGTREMMNHPAYHAVFGKPNLRDDSNAKDHFRTSEGGVVYAAGTDGTLTGLGAGKMRETFGGAVVIDDPQKAGEGNSETMRKNVREWFTTTMESRLNNRNTPIIIIQQRLHEEDLSGWLLDGGNGEKWEHLKIEAIKEDGTSFWPDNSNFEIDNLRRREKANSYVFAGQYMQRPAPLGGGILKDSWWKYWEALPKIKSRSIYADTAQKTKDHNDYSVLQCWGTSDDGAKYLLDQIRGKWEAPELLVNARAFWNKHKAVNGLGRLRSMKVEDKASGTGLIQTLQRERIPIVGIQRNIDKITRAYDAAPEIEVGNVYLPKDAPWLADFLAEASAFPNGKHDDMMDVVFDAVTDKDQVLSLIGVV